MLCNYHGENKIMFKNLSEKLSSVFSSLGRKGVVTETDINSAMRAIKIALVEADVSLSVIQKMMSDIKDKALGQSVIKSITPDQMIIKIVNDHLVEVLSDEKGHELNLSVKPPAVIMMVGLQGSGKTSTTAKIAYRLKNKQNKKVLVASLDVYRPAAWEQLSVLAKDNDIDIVSKIDGEEPASISKRSLEFAKAGGYDVLILDTAGRLHTDDELMDELKQVKSISPPAETLLVADSLIGQDAVNVGKTFHDEIGITGVVLSRVDGDGRGGAALSMRMVTGSPIKFMGIGESIKDLEQFHPERVASRILEMGDIVSLVEKAEEELDESEAKKMQSRLEKGIFSLDDYAKQLDYIGKLGGMGSIISMIPGLSKMTSGIDTGAIEKGVFKKQRATIISSMTPYERRNYKMIKAKRKLRIASGSGVRVQDVNILLKQFGSMHTMMRKFKGGINPSNMGSIKNLFSGR